MSTLAAYRRAVAPLLGPYAQGTAAAASSTTALVASGWPFVSSLAQDDLYADHYLFRPAAAAAGDKTRVVATYTASTGTLTPDATWTNAPDGETFELHGLVPPVADGVNDLHALINEALKTIDLIVEVTGAPTADAQRHSLGTIAAWADRPAQVYAVGWLGANEDRNEVDPFRRPIRGEAEIDGETVSLNHPGRTFRTDDTLWVRMTRPAYTYCRPAAGTFGVQDGLALEDDECPAAAEWVAAATLVQAWRRLATVLAPGDAGRAQTEQAKAAAIASRFQRNYLEAARPKRSFRPLLHFGPVRR